MIVEGFLHQVDLCGEVGVRIALDDGVVVHDTYGRTVVLLVGTADEGDVVVGNEACPGDDIIEVGVVSSVIGI